MFLLFFFYRNMEILFMFFSQAWEPDSSAESWREALETRFTEYTANHYKHGVCAVFGQGRGDSISLVACIEDHQFQPKNYWFVVVIWTYLNVGFNCWSCCHLGMAVGDLSGVQHLMGGLENFRVLFGSRYLFFHYWMNWKPQSLFSI